MSECARLEGRRHRCGRRAAESGPAFQVSGQGFGGCGAPRVSARFSPKICSRDALGPRVGAVDAPWVRGLPTGSAQIPVAEACGWGQRGRRPERPAGGRAQAPRRAPHRGPPLEPPRLGARGSASGKFVPRTARSLLSPLPLANGVGSCVTLSLATPKGVGRLQELLLCYCLSNRPFLLGEGRGACGGSRARITLIKALFPQRSRAQMIVNPNKIGSRRNGTL